MSALVDVTLEGLRLGEDDALVAAPSLVADLTAAVAALDAALLGAELDELRVFCDTLIGRGAAAVAEQIIDAVAEAKDARPRPEVSAAAERGWRNTVGAPAAPSVADAAPPARGRSWLAVRSAS
jgi:hypothetical protein